MANRVRAVQLDRTLRGALAIAGSALVVAACGGDDNSPPAAAVSQAPPLAVTTAEGPVIGTAANGTVSFKGIPYADPPVGPLRWAPTRPATARSAPLDASAFGAACPQPATGGEKVTSENCLFLNVWKPQSAASGSKLPVVVYIHGGAFTLGSGGGDMSRLASKGVVGVSLNYRLGALGYLANAALRSSNRDGSLGNFALMDQMAALAWVQRNIAAFGGDPTNVTIWGTSAGATQSFSLLQSPKAKGLFQRAIMQSGGASEYSNPSQASALAVGDAAVAALGCDKAADVVACLRALPVSALLNETGRKWRPTVDAQIVTQVPAQAFATGNFNQVPVMTGGVYDEGTLFVDPALPAAAYLPYLHGLAPAGFDTTAIDAAYPISGYAVPAQGIARAIGDAMYACGNSARRDTLSAWVPVFAWEFTDPALSFPAAPTQFYYGTAHGMDSFYLFDTVDQLATYPYFDERTAPQDPDRTKARQALAAQMSSYIVNFVKTGDPNGDGTNIPVRWPRFTGPTDRAMIAFSYPVIKITNNAFETAHKCDTVWGPTVFPSIY